MKIFISGSSGFVGSALLTRLIKENRFELIGTVRNASCSLPHEVNRIILPELVDCDCFKEELAGVDVVVHLAGRAHVLKEIGKCQLTEFRKVNVLGSEALARQALLAGVKRFIFVSSIGVNGNRTDGVAFTELDQPKPRENYAISKFEAEVSLRRLFAGTTVELVVIRPPLVYGPDAPGNFGRLMKLVSNHSYLPFGAINNKRSFVSLDNLVDLIVTCLDHPSAANQIFLAGDGEDLSTTDLLRQMGKALGKYPRLLSVPSWFLMAGATLIGKRALALRLLGNLQVDISKTKSLLNWNPPVSPGEGLIRAARSYSSEKKTSSTHLGHKLKRIFDFIFSFFLSILLLLPMCIVALAVKLTSPGPILYWSNRIGRANQLFKMPKFRTMRVGTPAVATHLLNDPNIYLTPIGSFLRKSSLDELPQLLSILAGNMSFVGPRPALFNQDDLILQRTQYGVHELLPGLTGWAQINGRDELPISEKVKLDVEYLRRRSLRFDGLILFLTIVKVLKRDGVSH